MSTVIERISPRYDVWETSEVEPEPVWAEGAAEVLRHSVSLAWLVASPFIVLADWLRGVNKAAGEPPEWESLGQVGRYQIWSQTWMDSASFPVDLDLYDRPEEVYLLFRLRFAPALPELEALHFFEEMLLTDRGLFLLSYNPNGEGMTLWSVPREAEGPEAIARLASREWELEGQPGGALRLSSLDEEAETVVMVVPR